jgi:hypothetical protein
MEYNELDFKDFTVNELLLRTEGILKLFAGNIDNQL